MAIYLPANYEDSSTRYPVVYFLANGADGHHAAFDRNEAQSLFDTASSARTIEPFILVSPDMNTPLSTSWFVDSPATVRPSDHVFASQLGRSRPSQVHGRSEGRQLLAIFTSIFQAHLPNAGKPPLFIDLPARRDGDRLVIDSRLTERLQNSFLLDRQIPRYADNLNSLIGFKFDWARGDTNQDHVYANQAFTRKLDEFGITHEAEEYRGG